MPNRNNPMRKILLTGANGYIGRHIAHYLACDCKNKILASDLHPLSVDGYKDYIQEDLANPRNIGHLVEDIDYIFFFCGATGSFELSSDPAKCVQSNEIALLNLLHAISDKKVKKPKIIFPSTRLIYSGLKDTPLVEEHTIGLKSIYSVSKYSCEQYLRIFENLDYINYTVFRICLPYGTSFLDHRFSYGTCSMFINMAINEKCIKVYGDGGQKRSLIHIMDLVRIISTVGMDRDSDNSLYNIGGPDTLSINEIAVAVANKFGAEIVHVPWTKLRLRMETGDTIFCSNKIESQFPVEYHFDFKTWLRDQ